jgi:tetratricopeptide (TPR) repeat protein
MRLIFAGVFPPQLVYYQGRQVVVDRAHNLWLDVAMSGGLASAVAFATLLIGVGRLAWRGLRAASDLWERPIWVALAAAIAGHLADLQFGFDLTASATIFWLSLGLAAAMGQGMTSSASRQVAPSKPTAWLPYLFPALGTLALAGQLCLRPLLADAACWQARQGERSLRERSAAAERAVRLWPLEPEYHLRLAWAYLESGDIVAAEAQLAAADSLNADDPSIWAAWGELYALWGETEAERYRQAEMAYRQALELAPNVATYHTALGLVLAHQGQVEEGVAELERAVALDATDGVAYRYLADLYQTVGHDAQADWARREAARWGDKQEVQMGK